MKRVFLIVLDSLGIGEQCDSASFGDVGVNTLRTCAQSGQLHIPNLLRAGLSNIDGVDYLPEEASPIGAYARLKEASKGKDTTIGHWEIAGIVSETPLPTYPNGFPEEILAPFRAQTGRGVLANAPWSGTAVIEKYAQEHIQTGDLIVYTSADSVFQIAAHENIVPPETLYEYCRIARKLLCGKHNVGRVIARPFVGKAGNFVRTANRHDFSCLPPRETLLDALKESGREVIGIGKISDIFADRGITRTIHTANNQEGMAALCECAKQNFTGLCFANLVDFDMLYGHRRNTLGYTQALNNFDAWLGEFLPMLGEEDLLFITADHGCDPAYTASTDHTREAVPLLILGKCVRPVNLGTRDSFSHIAATIADLFDTTLETNAESFAGEIL